MDTISFESELDTETFAFYRAEVKHLEVAKKKVEDKMLEEAKKKRWESRVEAITRLRGIGKLTAFATIAEAVVFSRFQGAPAFWSLSRYDAL